MGAPTEAPQTLVPTAYIVLGEVELSCPFSSAVTDENECQTASSILGLSFMATGSCAGGPGGCQAYKFGDYDQGYFNTAGSGTAANWRLICRQAPTTPVPTMAPGYTTHPDQQIHFCDSSSVQLAAHQGTIPQVSEKQSEIGPAYNRKTIVNR